MQSKSVNENLEEIQKLISTFYKEPVSWELTSLKFGPGLEILLLKRNGESFFEYRPTKDGTWLIYSFDFPVKEVIGRVACLKHAELMAGKTLEVRDFPGSIK